MKRKITTVTNWLFITTQISALIWVTISYIIAAYSTIFLKEPFPVVSLSQTAIEVILGVTALKVLGNIFEHNDGVVFGKTKTVENTDDNEGVG